MDINTDRFNKSDTCTSPLQKMRNAYPKLTHLAEISNMETHVQNLEFCNINIKMELLLQVDRS